MPYLTVCNWQLSWTLTLVFGYLFYLLLGATVFQLLEKQAEAQSRDQFQMKKLMFLQNYTCLDRQALEQFVQPRPGRGIRAPLMGPSEGGRSLGPQIELLPRLRLFPAPSLAFFLPRHRR
ncbi:potassium channel subfamily K member 16 [Crotalus adamanteus]|uniref:Potassium channel subfamily K member 16 n=1 Tax=Crotalus adamanteus TaxID=8729 RepID=A0AAW1CE63_CROAD